MSCSFCKYWLTPIPGRECSASVGTCLGYHECFSACLSTSWTETGWIRWKEVDSRRSGEHFDVILVTGFLRLRAQQNLAKSRYVVRKHPQKTRKWRTTLDWGNLWRNLICLQYSWFDTQRRECLYYRTISSFMYPTSESNSYVARQSTLIAHRTFYGFQPLKYVPNRTKPETNHSGYL